MKLSQLRSLCDITIEKYGDINVGTYSQDYAYDITQEEDMRSFKFRVVSGSSNLPGEAMAEETEDESMEPAVRFACIFYKD